MGAANRCGQSMVSLGLTQFYSCIIARNASLFATVECAAFIRCRSSAPKLHACRRGTLRHSGCGEPISQGSRDRTRRPLFKRRAERLGITDAGRDYLAVVHDVFDRLELGTDRLLQRQRSGTITVSASPDFAAKWLVARLGRFTEAYPEIELKLSATMHHVDFAREDVDLAIRHGNGNWPGLDAVNLTAEELFPVFSPSY